MGAFHYLLTLKKQYSIILHKIRFQLVQSNNMDTVLLDSEYRHSDEVLSRNKKSLSLSNVYTKLDFVQRMSLFVL